MHTASGRQPSLAQSLIPILVLIALLAASVYLFGDGSSGGPNQIALILAAGVGIIVGISNGFSWKAIEHGIVHGISLALGAILILLVVGSLIGSWILAGIVPTVGFFSKDGVLEALHLATDGEASVAAGTAWAVLVVAVLMLVVGGAADRRRGEIEA